MMNLKFYPKGELTFRRRLIFSYVRQRSYEGDICHGRPRVSLLLLVSLELMAMLLQHGHLDLLPLIIVDQLAVDHLVQGEVDYLLQRGGGHVQADGPAGQQRPQLEERVEGERRHVRFAPPVPSLLHVFLELHPASRLLPLHVAVLSHEELLHLTEHGVGLVVLPAIILPQQELDLLGWRRHWNIKELIAGQRVLIYDL